MSEHLEPERWRASVLQVCLSSTMGPPTPGEGAESLTSIFHLSWVPSSQSLLRKGRWTLGCNAAKVISANSTARSRVGADKHSPTEQAAGLYAESLTYLTRSLDVQVVEPFQDCNSGHHPNGRVMKVTVQHLNYSIQVQGHLDPLGAAWERESLVQHWMPNTLLSWRARLQHTRGCIKHLSSNPKKTSTVPLGCSCPTQSGHPHFLVCASRSAHGKPKNRAHVFKSYDSQEASSGLAGCEVTAGHGQVCPCGTGSF